MSRELKGYEKGILLFVLCVFVLLIFFEYDETGEIVFSWRLAKVAVKVIASFF